MSSSSSSNIVRVADGVSHGLYMRLRKTNFDNHGQNSYKKKSLLNEKEEQNEERKKQKTVLHGAFFMGFAERYQHSKYDEAIAGLDIPSKAKQEGFVSFTSVCLDDNRDPMHQDNLLLEMGGLQAVKEKLRDLGFQCEDGQFDHGHDLYVWNESERTMGLEVKCNTGSFSGQGNRSASRFAIVCYWEHNSVQFSLWEGKKQYKSIKRDGTDEMVEDCFRISHLYGNGEVSAQNIKSILAESGQIGELRTVGDHHKEILNKSKNPKFKVGVNGELLVARFFSDFGETLTRRVVLNPFNLTNTDAVAIVLDNNKLRFSKISVKCANRAFPYKHKDAGVCFKFTYQLFSCCEMHCFVLLPGENDTPIPITKQPNPVQKPSIFFLAKEEFATNEEKETGLRITNFQIQRLKEAGRMFEVEHATRAACEPLMQLVFHGEGVREFNFFVGPSNYHLAGSKPEIPDLPFLGFVGEVARLMVDKSFMTMTQIAFLITVILLLQNRAIRSKAGCRTCIPSF